MWLTILILSSYFAGFFTPIVIYYFVLPKVYKKLKKKYEENKNE